MPAAHTLLSPSSLAGGSATHPLQVPERQLLLLTAQCLAAQRDWPALQHMAGRQDRRAGLGMEQFIATAR